LTLGLPFSGITNRLNILQNEGAPINLKFVGSLNDENGTETTSSVLLTETSVGLQLAPLAGGMNTIFTGFTSQPVDSRKRNLCVSRTV
jgi:hypothetical protein